MAGADPTEILSLCDALDDPGDAAYAYSAAARERFALLVRRSCGCCAGTAASRCSTWSG